MSGRPLPEELPAPWLRRWEGDAEEPMPAHFEDAETLARPTPRRDEIDHTNELTVSGLLQSIDMLVAP
jgi:hypothetical protein